MDSSPDLLAEAVFGIVMLCWLVFAGAFLFSKKPPSVAEKKRENAATYGIALEGVGYALVWTFRRPTFTSIIPLLLLVELAISLVTVGIAVASVWLVLSAVRTLGKQWAFAARLVEGHKLITERVYSIVRNPIYTGMFGLMIATGLAISYWWTLPPAIAVFWIGTMLRIRSEEKLLREAFGKEFEEYARRVPALLPLWTQNRTANVQALMNQTYKDIIFLGDSITEECDWANLLQNPRIKNCGIGGDTSDGILKRLGPIISSMPQQIFLMAGINDLWNGVPVDRVVANFRRILTQCKNITPTTTLFIQSVLPMNGAWSSTPSRIPIVNAEAIALNNALRAMTSEFKYFYVDLHALLVKDRQLDAQYTSDGLHLNVKAYTVWKAAIQGLVETNPL